MDKPIPKEEIMRARRRKWIIASAVAAVVVGAILLVSNLARTSVNKSDLIIAEVGMGTIETSVSSTGRVVPAFEEVIISPISSRIMEVYLKAGDTVEAGTPILRLDLTTTQAELDKLLDQQGMKNLERENLRLNTTTSLSDMEMRIKVKEMEVNQLTQEVANEIYLDSLGTGTGDRVKEARLKLSTSSLELEQLRRQLENERLIARSNLQAKDLEMSIAQKNLSVQTRVLRDAEIRSPRRATITMIDAGIGQPVSQGGHVATIADLEHFKVEASITENQLDKVKAGSRATVKVGRREYGGRVTNVTPQSTGGSINFEVALDTDYDPGLRPGLKADVYVMWDVIEDAVRIPLIPVYTGPGVYDVFVVTPDGTELERRTVKLGDCNYDWVEVESGLAPGDKIVTTNLSKYSSYDRLKLND